MTAVLYALGVFVFAAGVMLSIALHEVGHMWPAKKFGIKVTKYFIGFGKTVWSVKRGDTEYGVKLFPLGGFVQLTGMLPPEKRDEHGRARQPTGFFGRLIADARAAEYERITPDDEGRLFYQKAWWKKVIVMSGGPMVNVILAIVFLGITFVGFGVPTPVPTVATVAPCITPVTSTTGHCTARNHTATPARSARLRPGDTITAINGTAVTGWDQTRAMIRANGGQSVRFRIVRDGRSLTVPVTLARIKQPSLTNPSRRVEVGYLGVVPRITNQRQSLGYVVSTMGSYTKRTGTAILDLPGRMFGVVKAGLGIEKRDPNSPMSVVGAGRVAGEVASANTISATDRWATLLQLLGVINLFIALFNFIPLLPLDGGHIAGALYEAVRRAVARVRGRPDPGYADVARMLPIAYTMAGVLLVMGVILIWADIVNPITLQS